MPLTKSRKILIREMLEALNRQVFSKINEDSNLCRPEFTDNFRDRLLLYHAFNADILNKKTFEFTFAKASEAAGREARIVSNPVNPGSDVIVNGTHYSLKTEASKGIKREKITISKLMEARWIRECRTKTDFDRLVKEKVLSHLKRYERILILRAYQTGTSRRSVEYQLVEIPLAILNSIKNLKSDDFSLPTKNNSSRASVKNESTTVFDISLDGSVEKVTIRNLKLSVCFEHAIWRIEIY
ncbi:hypothetical protein ACFLT9_01625 [Acidobacteriota bacterium]